MRTGLAVANLACALSTLVFCADTYAMRHNIWWRSPPALVGLPHRPLTGNHGQGAMVDASHCPGGSFPYYTEEGLFLTCMRGSP